ncbi:MAG: hypothetical protein D6675_09655 [Gemmatimonadetes bacterium]|nr:MAG: hypothetical protein D6675_09655 [Gemmatimonadota bacterium]
MSQPDTIILKADHNEPSTFLTVEHKSLTLIGKNDKRPQEHARIMATILLAGCEKVVIENIIFENSALIFRGAGDVELELRNCKFTSSNYRKLDLSRCRSILIDRCEFTNMDVVYKSPNPTQPLRLDYLQITNSILNGSALRLSHTGNRHNNAFILLSWNFFTNTSLYLMKIEPKVELFSNIFKFTSNFNFINLFNCDKIHLIHNVFYNFHQTGVVCAENNLVRISSNIFYSDQLEGTFLAVDGDGSVHLKYNNIYLKHNGTVLNNGFSQQCVNKGGNVYFDPEFRNPDRNDFRLKPRSIKFIGEYGQLMGIYSDTERIFMLSDADIQALKENGLPLAISFELTYLKDQKFKSVEEFRTALSDILPVESGTYWLQIRNRARKFVYHYPQAPIMAITLTPETRVSLAPRTMWPPVKPVETSIVFSTPEDKRVVTGLLVGMILVIGIVAAGVIALGRAAAGI